MQMHSALFYALFICLIMLAHSCEIGKYGTLCEPCPIGTYKSNTGTQACTLCPLATFDAGTDSNCVAAQRITTQQRLSTYSTGSTRLVQCACPAGREWDGSQCRRCDSGSAKPYTSLVLQPSDAVNPYNLVGLGPQNPEEKSISCKVIWKDKGAVTKFGSGCTENGYESFLSLCAASSDYQCTVGATDAVCIEGYTGSDYSQRIFGIYGGGPLSEWFSKTYFYSDIPDYVCTKCPAGKYKPGLGSGNCIDCVAGQVSTEDRKKCMCNAGFTQVNNACVACSSAIGYNTDCSCAAGFYGPKQECTQCPTGKFKMSTCYDSNFNILPSSSCESLVACLSCASYYPNTDTKVGFIATSWFACKCNAGWGGDPHDAFKCTACAAGTFKAGLGDKTSYSDRNEPCSQCPAGTYSSTTGSTVCQNCTTHSTQVHSTSPIGSTSVTSCTCNSGYDKVGTNPFTCQPAPCAAGSTGPAGSCSPCVAGKYKAVTGSAPCDNCAAGKFSAVTGQSSSGTCQNCLAGKYASLTGSSVCANCFAGTYATLTGSTVCDNCAAGKFSAATGQSSSVTCQNCLDRFTRGVLERSEPGKVGRKMHTRQ
jgi:hypothetical protein